jgi:hypothetical protein
MEEVILSMEASHDIGDLSVETLLATSLSPSSAMLAAET